MMQHFRGADYNDSPMSHASPVQYPLNGGGRVNDPLHPAGHHALTDSSHVNSGSQPGDLDLMIDPWSGDPLNFEAVAPVLAPGGEERSVVSQDVTSTSVRTDVSGPGPELRRFCMAAASPQGAEKDPMDRTTSPVPYESKKVMPRWDDRDFEAAAPDADAAPRGRVTFAAVTTAHERGIWTPSPPTGD